MPSISPPVARSELARRQGDNDDGTTGTTTIVTIVRHASNHDETLNHTTLKLLTTSPLHPQVVVALVAFALASTLTYLLLRALRRKYPNPTYVPTHYLRQRWRAWTPGSLAKSNRNNQAYSQTLDLSNPTLHPRNSTNLPAASDEPSTVDRTTSLRSIMTLPTYKRSLRATEKLLGREGERAGIDRVIEAPETLDEEEERREEEMASLYSIREQRRREAVETAERRERRREAREAGDRVALAALREESQLRALEREERGAQALIAEHQSREWERRGRVSSVDYAAVGIARHDGSRVRAASDESERPLLDAAAGMGGGSGNGRASIPASISSHHRRRDGSVGSAASADAHFDAADGMSGFELPPFARRVSDLSLLNSYNSSGSPQNISRSRASSAATAVARPGIETGDLGAARLPEPPSYDQQDFAGEEAPPYSSPVDRRGLEWPSQAMTQRYGDEDRNQDEDRDSNSDATEDDASEGGGARRPTVSTAAPVLPEIGRLPSIRIAEASPVGPRTGAAGGGFLESVLENGRSSGSR